MTTVSQLPAQLDAECVAGDPFTLSVTSTGATITAPAVTLRDAQGSPITGTVPTVTQVGAVTTVAFSAATTAALNGDPTRPRVLTWSLAATVDGSGPFQLIARRITVYPVGTAGVSTSSSATLAVTVGSQAVTLAVALGGGATVVVPPINRATAGVYANFPTSVGGSTAATLQANGNLWFTPVMLAVGRTADRIGIEVTTGGTASVSVHRLGIWEDGGGVPGTLLLDAGTVATATTGIKEVTISQALAANTVYWFGVAQQGAPAVLAAIRTVATMGPVMLSTNPAFTPAGFEARSVTGALASTPSLFINGFSVPRIFLRFT